MSDSKRAWLNNLCLSQLDRNYTAKVADFGLSKEGLAEKMTSAVGYLPFQAPEVFIGNSYSEKADIYSFGMVVWFLFAGVQPDNGLLNQHFIFASSLLFTLLP